MLDPITLTHCSFSETYAYHFASSSTRKMLAITSDSKHGNALGKVIDEYELSYFANVIYMGKC